jgi:hypothetical protein
MTDTPTPDPFDTADYYACDDPEHLSHSDPGEALEDYLCNTLYEKGQSLRACIEEHAPIEVQAYCHIQISSEALQYEAEHLVERFVESMCEDFGDPHGDSDFFKEKDSEEILAKAFAEVLEAHRHLYHVWTCENVATREYDEEELLEMFKDRIVEEETKSP